MPEYLSTLQYSNDREGPWRLYIYEADGFHRGGQWFRKPPLKYADEEITAIEALKLAAFALRDKKEIRVCDGGDALVYHAKDGKCLYPPDGGNFWMEITS